MWKEALMSPIKVAKKDDWDRLEVILRWLVATRPSLHNGHGAP
jgi:hypothetical protein